MHKNAHDKGFRESRGDVLITRGMNVFSASLGVSGECDVLEFHRCADGISLNDREGLWQPYPVEYKRGSFNERSGVMLRFAHRQYVWKKCCVVIFLKERFTMEKHAAE